MALGRVCLVRPLPVSLGLGRWLFWDKALRGGRAVAEKAGLNFPAVDTLVYEPCEPADMAGVLLSRRFVQLHAAHFAQMVIDHMEDFVRKNTVFARRSRKLTYIEKVKSRPQGDNKALDGP